MDGHTEEIREVHGNSPHPAGDFDLTTHEGWVEYGKYSYSDLRFKAPIKENLCAMTEKVQADDVQELCGVAQNNIKLEL